MKNNKQADFYFKVEVNGKTQMIVISEEQLRQVIKQAKIRRDEEKDIMLHFQINEDIVRIPFKMSQINLLLKKAELSRMLVPNSLSDYLQDVTQKLSQNPIEPIVKREHELEKIWFYISQKRRNNVFITGDMDVGKTAIACEVARQISTNECPKEFYEKRVLLLRPEMLLKIKGEYAYERTIKKVMNFLVENRKRIVLYIDNALYMKTEEYLIMMLYACIKKYHIPVMATLNMEDYERYFRADTSISKYLNEVYINEPENDELRPMIESHLKLFEKRYKVKMSEEAIKFGIYTSTLSESPSAEPGNVISIFEKAFLEAKRKGKKQVDKQCILSCYNTYLKNYERTPEEEKRATAYHETGHYLAHILSQHQKNIKISCVSILPMMWWEGVTISYYDTKEYAITSREYFIDQIAILLAGRIAEKKMTNTDSTGACNDLERTNATAKAIVMKWGFSEKASSKNRSYDYEDYFLMPESKKELIDQEIQELIDAGTKRAEKMINDNEGLLKVIAEKLMVEEILTGEELQKICEDYQANN